MKKLQILVAVLMLALFNPAIAADISQEKKALIDELLDQTGQSAKDVGKQFANAFIQQMTTVLRQSRPDIDPKAFTIVEEEVNQIMNETFVEGGSFAEIVYPIYDKHFTADELRQMIEYNKTPIGQKIIQVMPQVTQESMQAGREWGQSMGPEIQKRIQKRFDEEGIELQ